MAVFRMPSLGSDMEDGKLVEWLVAPGDTVARGDVVAVVETQKGAIEIEVFTPGVVERLDAAIGKTLPVGAPLAVIRGADEAEEAPPPPQELLATEAPQVAAAPAPALAHADVASDGPAASPAARQLGAEAGIDLAMLTGTGPGGAIVLADVERARRGAAVRPRGKPGLDLTAMRDAVAAAMSRSKHEIPHYYLAHEVDLTRADAWLAARNAGRPPDARLLMGALFLKATALAATSVPGMNGHYTGGAFHPAETVNAGLAVALRGGGLVAPAIMGAGALDMDQLMAAMRDLVMRVRTGRLKGSEMTDGTITVSSLGETGVDGMTGVIYPPQVALVAFGTPRPLPRVKDGAVVPAPCVHVTLAADHRVSDGRRGAKFLGEIARHLQDPEGL